MAGLATSGTLTHWFRDSSPASSIRATAMATLAAEAARSPPGAKRARRAALFLRRANADPRSAGQGRDLRPRPDAHPRRHLPRCCSKASPTAPSHVFDTFAEAGQAPRAIVRGRRRHPEPGLVAGDLGHRRSAPRSCARPAGRGLSATPSSPRSRSATSPAKRLSGAGIRCSPKSPRMPRQQRLMRRATTLSRGLYPATRHLMHRSVAAPQIRSATR